MWDLDGWFVDILFEIPVNPVIVEQVENIAEPAIEIADALFEPTVNPVNIKQPENIVGPLGDIAVDSAIARQAPRRPMLNIAIGLTGSGILWSLALLYPSVFFSDEPLGSSFDKFLTIALVAAPFLTVDGLLRLATPDLVVNAELGSGPMAGFLYTEKVSKQRRIMIIAGIAGAVNLIVTMVIAAQQAS